ncbi:MAG: hypothetical protein WBI74_12860 [Caldicoprobacterales bacterium]
MKIVKDNKTFHFSPTQILALGFLLIILVGAFLLSLPFLHPAEPVLVL